MRSTKLSTFITFLFALSFVVVTYTDDVEKIPLKIEEHLLENSTEETDVDTVSKKKFFLIENYIFYIIFRRRMSQ